MATTLFFSYSHKDEQLRDKLETSLVMLKRQGLIDAWHDRRIAAGEELDGAVDRALETADVILLLVSPDFLASAYCYDREMKRAMERHRSGEATVIPVILRPCEWHHADFGTLMATPADGKPVRLWANEDEAFLDITKAIRAALARMSAARVNPSPGKVVQPAATHAPAASRARSSNLRVTKTFTERDRDLFLHEAFECAANLFEGSLAELEARNPGIETSYRRVDANRFAAAIYRGGKAISRCTIFLGGYTRGITEIRYSNGDTDGSNSWNDSLSAETEEHGLHLKAMGMLQRADKLSLQGGAEYLWARLMEPLQRR